MELDAMLFKVGAFAASGLLILSSPALGVGGYSWITSPVNGHRYSMTDTASWSGALSIATANSAQLATVRASAKNFPV